MIEFYNSEIYVVAVDKKNGTYGYTRMFNPMVSMSADASTEIRGCLGKFEQRNLNQCDHFANIQEDEILNIIAEDICLNK